MAATCIPPDIQTTNPRWRAAGDPVNVACMKHPAGKHRTVAQRRTGSVRSAVMRAANDNDLCSAPILFYAWDVYRAAARARWVGRVVAGDADAAIEMAAVEFRTDIKKLIAVRRYEIA
jgi:hypothetical protein